MASVDENWHTSGDSDIATTIVATWTVQNSLDSADAGMPLAQDCPAPLIDSTTGHYDNTGTHSSSLRIYKYGPHIYK